ncbi:MAG TPA: CHAT domain-containing protein [Pyrinomonadaceae bacterium]|nr:CHAT domain-containing protein [Pyrinomonadaceae bacterium]
MPPGRSLAITSRTASAPAPTRRPPPCARARRATLGLLLLLACAAFAPPHARAQFEPRPIERHISGGEIHTFRLRLNSGQFIRAVFDQRGADVVLSLRGPRDEELLRIDSPVGEWGPEPLFFEVEEAGFYTIGVRPRRDAAGPGRYEFRVTARRATEQDERRFPAERVFIAATRLLTDADAAALGASLAKYEEALRLFREAEDFRGEVTTLATLASVSHALGDARQSLRFYEEALALLRASSETAEEARLLARAALVHDSLGDRERALAHFRQALSLFRAAGDPLASAYTLNQVGHFHRAAGDDRKALAHYEQALPLFRAAGDRRGEAVTLNHVGLAYDALRERERARDSFRSSLAVFETAGDCREVGPALSNLAADALDSGDRRKALEYLARALAVQRAIRDREGEAVTLNNLGFVYHTAGDHARAFEHFHLALAAHREAGSRRGEGDTLSNLMFAWAARGRGALAAFHGKQAVNAYQEVRASIAPLDVEAQKSFLLPREVVYHRLAELLVAQGRLPEAQQVVRMLKEEEYSDFVRRDSGTGSSAPAPATLTPDEAEAEKRYAEAAEDVAVRGRRRAELLGKSSRTPEEEKQLTALDAQLAAAGLAFQSFLDRLATELGDTKQAARVDQVRESQGLMEDLRELGAGAVALYTLVGEEKYRVILITPDVQVAREYPIKAAELNRKVAEFREALQRPSSDPRPLARELYRVLVGPVARDLEQARAETLMWSLDGVLRYVPVAALHDGERYMVERYRNVVFTPASAARLKDEPSPRWRGLGFGVSKPVGEFAALPAVPEELRGIIREADAGPGVLPGRIALDEDFTLEALRAGLRQRFPLVHVASHFAFQPGREADSFLLLGDGTRLSLAQIKVAQNLFGGVELLTLSACDTATGGAGADGKEVEGFAVLAQRQGAKAVVASLWPVADASTRLLMQEFYGLRDAGEGMLKAEALRRSQLALLRGGASAEGASASRGLSKETLTSKTPYAHPYFWAPFILIGNWR